MNPIVENLTGMDTITDQVMATDLLIAAKTGMKLCAITLGESATPEVRQFVRNQFEESAAMHEKMTNYMMQKGWYHPYNVSEQLQLDMKNAERALSIAK